LCFLLVGNNALAQQSVIEHCRKTSSDADRIACLEAALIGKEVQAEPKTQSQIDPPSMDIEAGPADDAIEPTASTEPVVEGIGAGQVIARSQAIEERDAALEKALGMVIAKYEWVPYERLVVTFENGQVWRQIKGDTTRIRTNLERNQTADITESGLGGYKLRLNEIRRTIRVERVR